VPTDPSLPTGPGAYWCRWRSLTSEPWPTAYNAVAFVRGVPPFCDAEVVLLRQEADRCGWRWDLDTIEFGPLISRPPVPASSLISRPPAPLASRKKKRPAAR
jgi:hypothetical protein